MSSQRRTQTQRHTRSNTLVALGMKREMAFSHLCLKAEEERRELPEEAGTWTLAWRSEEAAELDTDRPRVQRSLINSTNTDHKRF